MIQSTPNGQQIKPSPTFFPYSSLFHCEISQFMQVKWVMDAVDFFSFFLKCATCCTVDFLFSEKQNGLQIMRNFFMIQLTPNG